MAQNHPPKTILFLPMQTKVEFSHEESVLEVALQHEIPIAHSCGGMGSCGTCRIEVKSALGDLAPRNQVESEMALDRGFSDSLRLACQLTPNDGLVAEICLILQDFE